MQENKGFSLNGYVVFVILLADLMLVLNHASAGSVGLFTVILGALGVVSIPGFFMVQPNQAKVMTFFGSYVGTVKVNGLNWTVPLFVRKNTVMLFCARI